MQKCSSYGERGGGALPNINFGGVLGGGCYDGPHFGDAKVTHMVLPNNMITDYPVIPEHTQVF